ncbi:MAG: DUF72 domain-containing protein [Dehalococcoidaceae bacterium]|nr:DUF72 domain-containing protein [Dehalococcoidaceae bacterium]
MVNKAEVYIGTSGWSYPAGEGTWKGHFYPRGTKNELEHYCRFFHAVELNSSFYRPPAPELAHKWAATVPEGFLFTVKLWQKFTHPGMYEAATGEPAAISPDDVAIFKSSLEPLRQSGKLGALLAQFPPSFKNSEDSRRLLAALMHTFGGYRLAVELRHRSWSDDPATVEMLQAGNACWVWQDEPMFGTSIAGDLPLTADFAYFRFHGRNAEMWWKGNVETRYKYLYSPQEITELAGKMETAASRVKQVFAFFNNHYQAFAPRNAIGMMKELGLTTGHLSWKRLFPDE